ncbi:sensor histidine kinase [Candidatus Enterococcus ferrettii]|uniref:histidine kinase n=1 Tax=Candidatus Enterococcus ferrettii TaxID=2815324 RepID=A0ABV0ERQ9_9ENTE|nr:HAMP domain-containing sensor histidine kinase [Enterococcus sp. 665A]MBO1341928.1 HAMP domain-containing histidine kinase [Enterococcus sp. 665A]
MHSFSKYITKYLSAFAGFILLLLLINLILFGLAFQKIIFQSKEAPSPKVMLEQTTKDFSAEGLSNQGKQRLEKQNIWGMYLDESGQAVWSLDLPKGVPTAYSLQDVATFSKGYIADYPVFIQKEGAGLLVLGYPKNSFTKLMNNYYPIQTIKSLPIFVFVVLSLDFILLFGAYFLSKRKIIASTQPIVEGLQQLSAGETVQLKTKNELSEVAKNLNLVSYKLSQQNEARANWISGVSHDIRTPLSMILGYADRIAADKTTNHATQEQAAIILQQSIKIKELVQDLNLVSQLEYDMQPLNKASIHVAKLLRSYAAELLNSGISNKYELELVIPAEAETFYFTCDERLLTRAVNNLVQNSIQHNPEGCNIQISLSLEAQAFAITVTDDGQGASKLDLQQWIDSNSLNSTDEHLQLRHGLGLHLVQQITHAHQGTMTVETNLKKGFQTTLMFPF